MQKDWQSTCTIFPTEGTRAEDTPSKFRVRLIDQDTDDVWFLLPPVPPSPVGKWVSEHHTYEAPTFETVADAQRAINNAKAPEPAPQPHRLAKLMGGPK